MKSIPFWFLALLSLALGVVTAYARDPAEAVKIRHLIAAVETLEGAQFLRNGRAYDATAAAEHLRLKLKTVGDRVKTAGDFIRICGSRSSLSGEKYRIRFVDGRTVDAEVYFQNILKAFPADKP